MKIHAAKLSQAEILSGKKSDTLSLNGSVLTINGTDYDLDAATALPVIDEETGQTESPENQRVYLQNSETIVYLKIDDLHQFDFVNKNFALFFDTDLNGDISPEELAAYVEHYNLTEDERRANRKAIKDGFTAKEWKARIDALKA